MKRVKTFLLLAAVHLALTIGAAWVAVHASLLAIFGGESIPTAVAGTMAEMALWVLGVPLLAGAWAADAGFWSTERFLAVAALNSTVWVGSAVLLARWLHPNRPRLLTGVYPAVDPER